MINITKVKCLGIFIILTFALFASCAANDTGDGIKHGSDTKQETNKNIKNDLKRDITEKIGAVDNDTIDNYAVDYEDINTQEAMLSLKEITREEAGLKDVKFLESNKFNLNKKIHKLLEEGEYSPKYYQEGIIRENGCYIITRRFSENVIENLNANSSINDVIKILGEPAYNIDTSYYYITKELYIGFDENGFIIIRPFKFKEYSKYEKDILTEVLPKLQKYGLRSGEHSNFDGFSNNFLHGGGVIAKSPLGIEIIDFFDDRKVTVYANFRGRLFEYKDPNASFQISYVNEDKNVSEMNSTLQTIKYYEKRFEEEGKLSLGGSYKAIYEWVNSSDYYFIIRKMDYSQPDFKIIAPAGDYKWISDTKISYTDIFTQETNVIDIAR